MPRPLTPEEQKLLEFLSASKQAPYNMEQPAGLSTQSQNAAPLPTQSDPYDYTRGLSTRSQGVAETPQEIPTMKVNPMDLEAHTNESIEFGRSLGVLNKQAEDQFKQAQAAKYVGGQGDSGVNPPLAVPPSNDQYARQQAESVTGTPYAGGQIEPPWSIPKPQNTPQVTPEAQAALDQQWNVAQGGGGAPEQTPVTTRVGTSEGKSNRSAMTHYTKIINDEFGKQYDVKDWEGSLEKKQWEAETQDLHNQYSDVVNKHKQLEDVWNGALKEVMHLAVEKPRIEPNMAAALAMAFQGGMGVPLSQNLGFLALNKEYDEAAQTLDKRMKAALTNMNINRDEAKDLHTDANNLQNIIRQSEHIWKNEFHQSVMNTAEQSLKAAETRKSQAETDWTRTRPYYEAQSQGIAERNAKTNEARLSWEMNKDMLGIGQKPIELSEKEKEKIDAIVNVRELVNKMQGIIRKEGSTILPGQAKEDAGSTYEQLMMAVKNAEQLGALQKPEIDLLNRMMADPRKYNTLYKSKDTMLKSYENTADVLARGTKSFLQRSPQAAPYLYNAFRTSNMGIPADIAPLLQEKLPGQKSFDPTTGTITQYPPPRVQATGPAIGSIAPPSDDQKAQALAWAKANPNDPRAAAILRQLGVQ